jgi:nucleotide-binding universal stress UspA family protein
MLERFVVPLDTTPNSARILPYVTQLARQLGQPIELLAVIPDMEAFVEPARSTLSDALVAAERELFEFRRNYAQTYLDRIGSQLRDEGVWATTTVAHGDEAQQIVEDATAKRAGLIAMATHGRTGPERWFVGSVADKVVRTSEIPVLLIRPQDDNELTSPPVTAIVVPLDGSSEAEAALPYATFLAKSLGVPVTLARALDASWAVSATDGFGLYEGLSSDVVKAVEDEARIYLERTAEPLLAGGAQVNTEFLRLETPASAIEHLAEKMPGALVVMTTRGRSGIGRTILGSVTDKVIRTSGAPVLVIPPKHDAT